MTASFMARTLDIVQAMQYVYDGTLGPLQAIRDWVQANLSGDWAVVLDEAVWTVYIRNEPMGVSFTIAENDYVVLQSDGNFLKLERGIFQTLYQEVVSP